MARLCRHDSVTHDARVVNIRGTPKLRIGTTALFLCSVTPIGQGAPDANHRPSKKNKGRGS